MQPDPQVVADVIVHAMKSALAPLDARLAAAEARLAAIPPPVDPIPDDDLAASLTGLLRKEIGVIEPVRTHKRTVRDGQGQVKYEIEETR